MRDYFKIKVVRVDISSRNNYIVCFGKIRNLFREMRRKKLF